MRKGFVGFIFGIVSVVALILGVIAKMTKVTNVISHMKEDISEGLKYLMYGENEVTRLHKYSGRYTLDKSDDYYYHNYTPYNEYSASFNYSKERQDAIEKIYFESSDEAGEVFDKLVEASDGKKLTVKQFLDVVDPDEYFVTRKYLDSKFGWWYDGFFDNRVHIQRSFDNDNAWYISVPRPILIEGKDSND